MRSRRWLTERSENERLVMAYPTGVEERELETHQLTRVMYAVDVRFCLRSENFYARTCTTTSNLNV
jgi:hypothetical protein